MTHNMTYKHDYDDDNHYFNGATKSRYVLI